MKKITESPLIKIINDCISYFETNRDIVNFFPDIARELKTDTFRNAEEIAMKFYAGVDPALRKFVNEFSKNGYELPAVLDKNVKELIFYVNSYVSDAKYHMKTLDEMVAACQYLTGIFRANNNELLANEIFDSVAVIIKNSILTIEFGLTNDDQIDILDEVVKNIQTRNKKSGKVLGNTYLIKLNL